MGHCVVINTHFMSKPFILTKQNNLLYQVVYSKSDQRLSTFSMSDHVPDNKNDLHLVTFLSFHFIILCHTVNVKSRRVKDNNILPGAEILSKTDCVITPNQF